jgi:hypothetical protein
MNDGIDRLTLTERLELSKWQVERAFGNDRFVFPIAPYISGIEVTQAIQYYRASQHLTDPADRGSDNSLGLAAYKPAWVRLYVRSGFVARSTKLTGKIKVERKIAIFPVQWTTVAEFTPQSPGEVTALVAADYATERGSIGSTLNFIIPADSLHGYLRITASIWPVGGSAGSPSDSDEFHVNAMLRQTLRVRGIFVSYNGPNASGTVPNMNLPAPSVANLQTTCGNTLTVYPVESTGVFSSGGSIAWSTPLTGLATNPGGCSQQWLDLNVQIAQAKANDGNRTDVLYVGLIPSAIPIANVGGCNSSGVSAVPNGQQWTMAHELGHACGLAHGPCGTPGDTNYPAYEPYDPANTPTASLGEYGLDINDGTIHNPAQKDFMSYCGPVWMSLYHYSRLYNNDKLDPRWVDAPRKPPIPELYDPWLWPWEYIPDPAPWELPSHFAEVVVQPVIAVIGIVNLAGEVSVSSVMRVQTASSRRQDVTPTNMVAELIGANGNVAARAPVLQTHAHGSGCGCNGGGHDHGGHGSPELGYAFEATLPDIEPGSALRILRVDPDGQEENVEVWSRQAPGERPRISGVSAKVVGKREVQIRWQANCAKDQALTYSIQFSKDKGRSWNGLVAGLVEPSYRCPVAELPSGTIVFRVLAHDGFYTAQANAQPVRIAPRPPIVSIVHPYDGRSYQQGLPLRLLAAVNTHVGAMNEKLSVVWEVDGKAVGQGIECWLAPPKAGRRRVRVIARDDGGESSAEAQFTVERADQTQGGTTR